MSEKNVELTPEELKKLSKKERKKYENARLTSKQRVLKEVKEWVVSLAVAIIVVEVLKNFIFMPITVDGSSMYPTLNDGDRLAVTVYDVNIYNGVEKGDVVICHYPGRTSKHAILRFLTVKTDFVKRVVGVPGDTVSRVSGVTYINGEALDPSNKKSYSYTYTKAEDGTITYYVNGKETTMSDAQVMRYSFDYEYVLGEDEYFVVGDNRYNSHDSRAWNGPDLPYDTSNNAGGDVGPITYDMIVGHVRSVFWPLNEMRTVENNTEYMDSRDK